MRPFVLTGASSGGKSTLLAALASRGVATQPEIGRAIVEEQTACGGTALPWIDRVAFRDLLFERSLDAYDRMADHIGDVVIFDRSFLEAIAFSRLIGADVPASMIAEAGKRRFHDPVFVCPPWREIFTGDAERRHDFAFACRDHDANIETYLEFGYRIVELPKVPVSGRVDIVEQAIANA